MKQLKILSILTFPLLSLTGWGWFGHPDQTTFAMESQGPQKLLIVLTSNDRVADTDIPTGYWLKEAALPWQIFTDAGVQVDFASPKGGKAPVDQNSLNYLDSISSSAARNPRFIAATNTTIPLAEIQADEYDAVLYVGGHGPVWDFPDNPHIAEITTRLYENNKLVGAICHGLAALINIKRSDGSYLVSGHSITSISNEEEQVFERRDLLPFLLESVLVKRADRYSKAAAWQAHTEVSGNLVTAQNPASAAQLANRMLHLLTKDVAPLSSDQFWKLMKDIGDMGSFIAAVPSEGASANLLGVFSVEFDGRENVLQLKDSKDHIHLYPEHFRSINFSHVDVGYGPEPCILLMNHRQQPFLKLYYRGGSKSKRQRELMEANKSIAHVFTGLW